MDDVEGVSLPVPYVEPVGRSIARPLLTMDPVRDGIRINYFAREHFIPMTHIRECAAMPTNHITESLYAEAAILANIWNAADRYAMQHFDASILADYFGSITNDR